MNEFPNQARRRLSISINGAPPLERRRRSSNPGQRRFLSSFCATRAFTNFLMRPIGGSFLVFVLCDPRLYQLLDEADRRRFVYWEANGPFGRREAQIGRASRRGRV